MIPAITTHYAGRKFRSRVEARWAVFFDACGLAWRYESEGYALDAGAYLPDFWLSDVGFHFEVKGQEPTEAEIEKCREVSARTDQEVILAPGEPEERFGLMYFREGKLMPGRYVVARDVWSNNGFWLVGNNGAAVWIGPHKIPGVETRGPMFSGALEYAYGAALSADFGGKFPRQHLIAEQDTWRLDPLGEEDAA